ncbi:5'-methylthioadenosine/S-adenosylhomocysteine nucleosidase family protein [Winogradskyella pacifica]|uniref:5'-methylthioadenosine/S-adenosylhomocysteine nucleosidase family protein n=1 Tax=Winogradskyella pacifica TaxID=664642 RepID=UPI0015CEA8DA|nr:hypothetical protein [Winogradskyella pacifica]
MDTNNINIIVFDEDDNFKKSKELLGDEGYTIKRFFCIQKVDQLDHIIENQLKSDDYIFLVVHVFGKTDNLKGISKFKGSGIIEKYPNLEYMFISEGNKQDDIKKLMIDNKHNEFLLKNVFKYHEVRDELKTDRAKAITIKDLLNSNNKVEMEGETKLNSSNNQKYPQIKYAVITALFDDEFEELKKVFNFPEDKEIHTKKKVFYRGYLKENPEIEIIAAIPNATGMLDTSIIATQLLEFFNPEYLLMSGVCGGSEDTDFGDIILAKQIFTFQKGKISDVKTENSEGKVVDITLYDFDKNVIDYNKLFDQNGNLISVSIEKFEREHDSIISLDSLFEDKLNPKLDIVKQNINKNIKETSFIDNKSINIIIGPMACSTMVINKNGFFEDTIKGIHRKTVAVEMESYGVARACQFANNGKTIPIIFKSVMDKTVNKEDTVDGINYKKFAAYTSAQFMKELFLNKII